jgi:hypothetical protein
MAVRTGMLVLVGSLLGPSACRTGAAESEAMPNSMPDRSSDQLQSVEYERTSEPVANAGDGSVVSSQTPAPQVTAEVSPSTISLVGTLANPDGKSLVLYVTPAGYGGSPFEGYLLPSDAIHPIPNEGPWPAVPYRVFRMTVPPRTTVIFRSQIALDQFTYQGQPEGQIEWVLSYANRARQEGRLSVRLPPR